MEMEFKTTRQNGGSNPLPPDGDGWMLGGSANTLSVGFTPVEVFMYWQRPVRGKLRECSDVNCNAIAFTPDGRCIGCGTEYVEPS
jgi:hypothetical protein